MPYGGLSSQLGLAAETTVGTAVTVAKFFEILSGTDSQWDPTILEGQGVQTGVLGIRDARAVLSRKSASGTIVVEVPDQGGFGTLLKHALGSSAVATVITSTAYKQIHTLGSKDALGLTIQYAGPRTSDGTVIPLTYNGCKITDFELSVSDNQIMQAKATWDGWDETTATALATASYTAGASVFTFKDATLFKLGGTASTTAGLTSITSGVTVASLINQFTLTISTGVKNDRYGLGNTGTKANQVQNAYVTVTGSLQGEFTNRTEFYDLFKSQASTPFQLDFTHGDAGGGNPYTVSIIMPACRFKMDDVSGYGSPDVLGQKVDFEAYIDGTGTNPQLQIVLVSKDSTNP